MPDLVITITIPAAERADAIAAVLAAQPQEDGDERTPEEHVVEVLQTKVSRVLAGMHRKRHERSLATPNFGRPAPRGPDPDEE